MKQVVVIGSYIEALVMVCARVPVIGETLMGHSFRQTWGGKGSNQAVQAARLGARVSFASMVGMDGFGERFVAMMDAEGVEHSCVFRHESLPTATGFIICTEDGRNMITIDIGALSGLDEAHIDRVLQDVRSDTVVLLQMEIPLASVLYACRGAREKGATVVLNPAPASDLSGMDLSCVDYLTPNETETRVCLGLLPEDPADDIELGMRLLKRGCGAVVQTRGEQGCAIVRAAGVTRVAAYPVDRVVDSTGAGDSFNAALAVGLAEEMTLEAAARFANAAAGLSVTRPDTIASYRTRAEVEAFMEPGGASGWTQRIG